MILDNSLQLQAISSRLQAITWVNNGLAYWHIYASLIPKELNTVSNISNFMFVLVHTFVP